MSTLGQIKPTQERSRETLSKLLDAAETLLREQTFDELSISQIVRKAGVSVGTFYKRFTNKEALLQALINKYWQRSDRSREKAMREIERCECLEDRLDLMVDYYISDYTENAGVLRTIVVRWRTNFTEVRGTPEHRSVIQSIEHMAKSLTTGESSMQHDQAMLCIHLVANMCRDICLFPELLANDTMPKWRSELRAQLIDVCSGISRRTAPH